MTKELTALIADKTGYDPSELEPDFELEADLGIDTVKQAEIFGEIRERHGLARDDDFRLADYPTIETLAGYLADALANQGGPDDDPDGPSPDNASEASPNNQEPTTNHASEASPKASPTVPTHREEPVSPPLPSTFRLRRPLLVPAPAMPTEDLTGVTVRVHGNGELADALLNALSDAGATVSDGAADIVVDLGQDVLSTFDLAKELDRAHPQRWIAITRLGGFDRVSASAQDALVHGSHAGFAKAIGREWEETAARVVDFPPDADAESVISGIVDECRTPDGDTEVFRKGRVRRAIAYRVEDAPEAGRLPEGSVVLVTGGGRGISARVAHELARRSPITLILVGRGPIASEPLDLDAEKERIRNALKATGARVTPVEIERRLNPLRKSEEVRANVASMQSMGATVVYERADTADTASVRGLVARVLEEHGSIDYCIHGAGAEESRLVADKDTAAFHRVYDGKALGGLALAQSLPADCLLVTMGSVAGRFGNAGQVDYSAANDGLARMGSARGRSLHIDWTAWDDVGMAVRGGMKHLLTDRGVDLLPADAGSAVLVDLMAHGATGELIVAGALGDFLPAPSHPLLDKADHEGDRLVARRSMDLDTDPWIEDHSIDGTPVLPGVIGVELMTAAALIASPGHAYAGAQDVRFSQPAKIYNGQPLEIEVTAEPDQEGRVETVLVTERTLRTGRTQRTEHFSARIVVGLMPEIEGLPSAFLPDESLDQAAVYDRFFHGPRFQVIREVQGVSADALLAEGAVDPSLIADGLHTCPLVLEAAFQAAGLHHMLIADEMALPSTIDEVQLLGEPTPGEPLTLLVRRRGEAYDVDVDTAMGPILRLRGFTMAVLGPLPDDKRFPAPEWERPTVFPESGSPAGSGASGAIARARIGEDPTAWLTPTELAEVSARGTDRRIADRIAGRIAAKRALCQLTALAPHAITVHSAPSGEPVVTCVPARDVRVSITHRDGVAVARATLGQRVGIDLELVEERPESFVRTWFSASEQALLDHDPERLTVAWSAKEAVQKALGKGMAISPSDIEVIAVHPDGRVEVALRGRAASELDALGGGSLSLVWRAEGDEHVLVEARLQA